MLRQERRMFCVSLSSVQPREIFTKTFSSLQLPHELLSGRLRATIYIPGVSLRIISSFQFPTPSNVFNGWNLAGPSRHFCNDGAVCAKPARHGVQTARLLRGATLLQDFCAARTDFAGNSQLLFCCCCQSSADCCRGRRTQLAPESLVTQVLWVDLQCYLCYFLNHMLGIMFDDMWQQWTLVVTIFNISLSGDTQLRQMCLQRSERLQRSDCERWGVVLLTNCEENSDEAGSIQYAKWTAWNMPPEVEMLKNGCQQLLT